MRVALDAMGGDHAPVETVRGAVDAAGGDLQVILFGDASRLSEELSRYPANSAISIVPTTEEVAMHDHPVEAFRRKPDSSLRRAVEAVKKGQADTIVSAGNTGAAMTAALLLFGATSGVDRPAIGCPLPVADGKILLLDAGANVDCDAGNLLQFALMGSIFVHAAWGKESPRIGLLNIGEEPSKGNALAKQTYPRLTESGLNFIGNVEPRDFHSGKVDVVVCDGFVGNVVLKTSEGEAEMIGGALAAMGPEVGTELVKSVLSKLRSKIDYAFYGGAPLLGLNGDCFIAHGRSHAPAISNAILAAANAVRTGVVDQIRQRLKGRHQA